MENFIGIAIAVNFTSAVIVPMFLTFSNTTDNKSNALTSFKVIKNILTALCIVAAMYDACLFFFSQKGHQAIMNDFALPTVFYFIAISILFSTWRLLHVEYRYFKLLICNLSIGVASTIAYVIGVSIFDSGQQEFNYEHFKTFDESVVGAIVCKMQIILLLITILCYGFYTAILTVKAYKTSMELLPDEFKKGFKHMQRLTILSGIYFSLILGDMIFTSTGFDIFLLLFDPIVVVLIAIETLNAFTTYKKYEEAVEKRNIMENMASRDKAFMNALKKWVDNKRFCDGMLSVYDVARELGVSYGYMNNYFKNVVHVPFRTWRIGLRIDEAKRLIRENKEGLSIGDIALKVGYNDRANFFRHFKDYEDITPDEYRKNTMKP